MESTEAEQLGILPHESIRVKDAMSRSMAVESPTTGIGEAVRMMKSLAIDVIVVCEGGHLLGTLSGRDIALSNMSQSEPVHKAMTADPSYCLEQDLLIDARAIMRARRLTALPVLDPDGRISGVLTSTDDSPHARAYPGDIDKEV
jgi:CBS domain-containing protein